MVQLARNMKHNVKTLAVVTNHGQKERVVHAPSPGLKHTQQAILRYVFGHVDFGDSVHGFVPGRGIVSNASQHLGRDVVVNMDLKNFFPGIGAARVYTMFTREFGFGARNAWFLTKLTTFNDALTQGFPTSPAIANLVATRLDTRLKGLAISKGLAYTRYADDLTFSGDNHRDMRWLVAAVTDIARDCGFTVHPDKTAIMRKGRRQKVTGLVVNGDHGSPRVPPRIIADLRSACFHWRDQTAEKKQEIRGWISYVQSINPAKADMLNQQIEKGEKTWPRT